MEVKTLSYNQRNTVYIDFKESIEKIWTGSYCLDMQANDNLPHLFMHEWMPFRKGTTLPYALFASAP